MYGKNKVAGLRSVEDGFSLNSMFYTIQGEGPWAGFPSVFVRFAGCNLRCFWCDTEFEKIQANYSVPEMAAHLQDFCEKSNCFRLVFTGGEPMLQPLVNLMGHMPAKYIAQIETAGTIAPRQPLFSEAQRMLYVISPKTPDISKGFKSLTIRHVFKYILRAGELDPDDGLPDRSTQLEGRQSRIYRPWESMPMPELWHGRIFVQPCDEGDSTDEQRLRTELNRSVTAAVAMKHNYRLSMQLHKILGLP
jgi:7-carboxy-7-deazaguanine synthase